MALTDAVIRNAKAQEKPFKLGDQMGMYLLVQPSGAKLWRYKYRFAGKEKKLALGMYPEVKLSDARERLYEARRKVANGIDPAVHRSQARRAAMVASANSFKAVANEWIAKFMVKVLTHGGQDRKAVGRHLRYLSRDGELEFITDDELGRQGEDDERAMLDEWELDIDEVRRTSELSARDPPRPSKARPQNSVLDAARHAADEGARSCEGFRARGIRASAPIRDVTHG